MVEFRAEPDGGEGKAKAALTFLEREVASGRPKGAEALAVLRGPISTSSPPGPGVATAAAASSTPTTPVAADTLVAATASPTPTTPTTKTSVTAIDRMAAKASRYKTVRVLAAICLAVGLGLAVLSFVGGLAALVVLAMAEHPWGGVLAFLGALICAGLMSLAAKVVSDLLRRAVDVGDESRRMLHILEEHLNHHRERP
jgi:hypothetical protein